MLAKLLAGACTFFVVKAREAKVLVRPFEAAKPREVIKQQKDGGAVSFSASWRDATSAAI